MSGLEPLAIGAMIGGTALSATGSVMSGQERSNAAQFEASQYHIQEQQARTAALQDEAARRRDLTTSLETIQAIRAGRGVGSDSPTGTAILSSATGLAEDDILASRANYTSRADLANRASLLSERKARTSLLSGYLGAGESIVSGASRVLSPYRPTARV